MEMVVKILGIFISSLSYATPIIFAGLGGLYSEKAGVVNVGLEGMMVVGAFAAALVSYYVGPFVGGNGMLVIALLAAALLGAIFSLLHAIASVSFKANQIISGTALNLLSVALGVFLVKILFDGKAESPGAQVSYTMYTKFFGFDVNKGFILVLILVAITWFIFTKTRIGLRIRAVGENPSAVDTAGLSVYKLRYGSVVLGGALAGIGGAIAVLTFANGRFTALSISGLGFLGLASLVFGKWNPWGVFMAAIFFGFTRNMSETVVYNFPQIINYVPSVVLKILPYLLTIVALVLFSRSAAGPAASGKPYDKGER